jgi:tRNA(Phe) wybutosine-synthesizing methylase Tyw3
MFELAKASARKDRSRKGSIDEDGRAIVRMINEMPQYYTTSSCSSRIVFVEKAARKLKQNSCSQATNLQTTKPFGKRCRTHPDMRCG